MVGYLVSNEEEYNQRRTPFSGRLWPNGALRFTIVDAYEGRSTVLPRTTHDDSFVAAEESEPPQRRPRPVAPSDDVDVLTGRVADLSLNRHSFISDTSRQSCCSVEEGKAELKELMSSFLRDFNDIASSTFGEVIQSAPSEAPNDYTASSSPGDSAQLSTPGPNPMAEETSPVEDTGLGIPGAFVESVSRTRENGGSAHCGHCVRPINGYYHKCNGCVGYNLVRALRAAACPPLMSLSVW